MTKWRKGKPAEWVTEIEPEFDINERDNWQALWEYEQEICRQCGNLRSVCEDPTTAFNPQITTCYATVNRSMHSRKWGRKFEKVEPDQDGWHPTDGAHVWVTPHLPPDPIFGVTGEVAADDPQID